MTPDVATVSLLSSPLFPFVRVSLLSGLCARFVTPLVSSYFPLRPAFVSRGGGEGGGWN